MSIASKYEDRVAFTFEEVAPVLKFEAGSHISNVLKPETLRACEGEILKKLTFRVGDHQTTRYSAIHDNIRLGASRAFKGFKLDEKSLAVMEFWLTTVATYLASLFLLTQPGLRFSAEEITSASLYLGTKLIEKKTGITLMSRSLFD